MRETGAKPEIRRADQRFAEKYAHPDKYDRELDRDNSDYVYLREDLIDLPGRKFHRKRSHIRKTRSTLTFEYCPLTSGLVDQVLGMQSDWCRIRECETNPGLFNEDRALYEAMTNFAHLIILGGAIVMEERVAAFTLGELLNPETAVIHFEKADPDHPGLYPVINQLFARENFARVKYINREQDLGVPGLRKAKESYFPHHLEDKYTLTPRL